MQWSLGDARTVINGSVCPTGAVRQSLTGGRKLKLIFFARPVCINNLLEFLRKAQYGSSRSVGETECNVVSETPEP